MATAKGEFVPKNPKKYIGKYPIIFRSSWELPMMKTFDEHPSIVDWSSEGISIPYLNPVKRKWTMYIPDFFVRYIDKNNKMFIEVMEVKPMNQVPGGSIPGRKLSKNDHLVQAVNAAKFAAAIAFCQRRGWRFRVCTAEEMFAFKRTNK